MKLISWNVNARVKAVPEQVKALSCREPHIIALQDVRLTALAEYKQAFARIGLCHIIHTFQENTEKVPTGVLIASCFEMSRLPNLPPSIRWSKGLFLSDSAKIDRHWMKRTLFVTVQSPLGEIDLYNVYITPGVHKEKMSVGTRPYERIKLDLLSGIYHTLSTPQERLRILCGDFNTPQEEKQTGEIITWGYTSRLVRCLHLMGQNKIRLNVPFYKALRLMIFLMCIDAFMDMIIVALKKLVVGESTAMIISLLPRHYTHTIFATCKNSANSA